MDQNATFPYIIDKKIKDVKMSSIESYSMVVDRDSSTTLVSSSEPASQDYLVTTPSLELTVQNPCEIVVETLPVVTDITRYCDQSGAILGPF